MFVNRLVSQQKGFGLIETALALGMLGVIAVAFFSGLATGTRASMVTRDNTMAESLARSQLEYVKKCAYVTGTTVYPVDAGIPTGTGWVILPATSASLSTPDNGIQKITVTIQKNGETVFELSGYKIQ
ncbi:MAG: type II secretion system protein [Dehalococcoidales bacterium]|nr:type II secretion system protein [Dehalococcoidales bacterium]